LLCHWGFRLAIEIAIVIQARAMREQEFECGVAESWIYLFTPLGEHASNGVRPVQFALLYQDRGQSGCHGFGA